MEYEIIIVKTVRACVYFDAPNDESAVDIAESIYINAEKDMPINCETNFDYMLTNETTDTIIVDLAPDTMNYI